MSIIARFLGHSTLSRVPSNYVKDIYDAVTFLLDTSHF